MSAENARQAYYQRGFLSALQEKNVTRKYLWHGVLIVSLCAVLAVPTQADKITDDARNVVIGIVAVSVAVVVIAVVVVHESRKKRTVTGCVASGANGMSVTDEKDKQVYALSGNTADIKHGDRVTLQGKKAKPTGANSPLAWQVDKETKDFGACQP
jgi:hypothetical protein